MIYYLTPFCPQKRLGHIHNEYCKIVPNDDDYICLIDPDVMFLHPHQQKWIEDIVKAKGRDWDMLGCMTNRISVPDQLSWMHHTFTTFVSDTEWTFRPETSFLFNETNVSTHIDHAKYLFEEQDFKIQATNLVAGFLMIFRKSLWNKIKFQEGINFDIKFCEAVKASGGKIGIMKGIYVFHQYRLGRENPKSYKNHLL